MYHIFRYLGHASEEPGTRQNRLLSANGLSRELTKPAGRPADFASAGHRGTSWGIGYVSSKNSGIGRASCVEPMPARRWPAVSKHLLILPAGRRPAGRCFGLFATKAGLAAINIGMNSSSEHAMMNFGMYVTWASILNPSMDKKNQTKLNLN